jgi:hypothetical protein
MRDTETRLTGAKVSEVITGDGVHHEVVTLGPDGWDPADPRINIGDWGISDE